MIFRTDVSHLYFRTILFLSFPLFAQAQNLQTISLRGTITVDGGSGVSSAFLVEIRSLNRTFQAREFASPTGDFEFRGLNPGEYDVRVTTAAGNLLRQEHVVLSGFSPPLSFYIRLPAAERPVSGVVSVQQLRRSVPKKALKEFERAEQAMNRGDVPKAIDHLEKAVRIEPGYMEAHNNLGVRYTTLKQFDKAAQHFRSASHLAPWSAQVSANLGIALFMCGDLSGAELAARRSLELEPRSVPASYVLGVVMEKLGRDRDQALGYLRRAQGRYPNARLAVARIHLSRGETAMAESEVQQFLSVTNSGGTFTAEEILRQLSGGLK